MLKLRRMGTHRVQIKGVLPWLVRWACRANTRDFLCLGCSSRPSTKYVFSHPYNISVHLCLSPGKLGRQPCWVACLSVTVSVYGSAYKRNVLVHPLKGRRYIRAICIWMPREDMNKRWGRTGTVLRVLIN